MPSATLGLTKSGVLEEGPGPREPALPAFELPVGKEALAKSCLGRDLGLKQHGVHIPVPCGQVT